MKTFTLLLLLCAPALAQSLSLHWDYPPAAFDPTNEPIVFRVHHSPLITVPLTNWPVIRQATNALSVVIPKAPGFNNVSVSASNSLEGPVYSQIKSYFVAIPAANLRVAPAAPSAILAPRQAAVRTRPVSAVGLLVKP